MTRTIVLIITIVCLYESYSFSTIYDTGSFQFQQFLCRKDSDKKWQTRGYNFQGSKTVTNRCYSKLAGRRHDRGNSSRVRSGSNYR